MEPRPASLDDPSIPHRPSPVISHLLSIGRPLTAALRWAGCTSPCVPVSMVLEPGSCRFLFGAWAFLWPGQHGRAWSTVRALGAGAGGIQMGCGRGTCSQTGPEVRCSAVPPIRKQKVTPRRKSCEKAPLQSSYRMGFHIPLSFTYQANPRAWSRLPGPCVEIGAENPAPRIDWLFRRNA